MLPVLHKGQRGFLKLRQLFERIRDGDSILGGKGIENEGGRHAGGGGLLGASPSEALSIRLLMGWWMCLGVSMTTLLNARDISFVCNMSQCICRSIKTHLVALIFT